MEDKNMNEHLIESQIHTIPYRMTLQPQLLAKEQQNILKEYIMPLLKKQGIELKDVGESFHSLLSPLRLERIKEKRPFYLVLKGDNHSKRAVTVLINPSK
jgi:hypothetical protein